MAFTPVSLTEDLAAEVVSTLPAIGRHAHDLLFRLEGNTLEQFNKNKAVHKGGRDFRVPVLVQGDSSIKRLSGAMDVAPLVGFEPLMQYRETYKGYGKILVIDEDQLDDNSGPEQVIDILKMKRDVAIKGMNKEINDDLLFSGSDNHINSVVYHISTTPSTGPGWGGFSGTSYSFARNIQVTGGSFATGVAEGALNQAVIEAQKAQGAGKVDFLLSDEVVYRFFQNSKIGIQQMMLGGNGKVPGVGDITYNGIPWHYDVAYPNSTTLLGIKTDGCYIQSKGDSMTFGKPMEAMDQWFLAWKMKVRLNVAFPELPRQFVVTSLAA
jgi:hypothetical protein